MKIIATSLLSAIAALTVPPGAATDARPEPSLERPRSGPVDATFDGSWTVADSTEALTRSLADPSGPSRIGLLPRVYRGDFRITRPVELAGTRGAVLEGTGSATVLVITADRVTVRDVSVRHSGRRQTAEDAGIRATGSDVRVQRVDVGDTLFGIALEQCTRCLVENAHVVGLLDEPMLRGDAVKLWESHDSAVRDSVVEDSRDVVVWYSKRVTLEGNYITRSRYGAHFMHAHDSIVRRVRVVDNVVGIFVMYSTRVLVEDNVLAGAGGPAGIGIGFKDSDDVRLRGNWLVGNTAGAYLDSTPRTPDAKVSFDGNVIALNDVGLRFHSSEKGVELRGNDFRGNAALVEVEGGGNALGVSFTGNYFSSYEGYDLDHDGTGDIPYEEKLLSSALTDARPALKLLDGTLAMGLIDAASRAIPVLAARTLLVDRRPLMSPGTGRLARR